MSVAEAEADARRSFGNVEYLKEAARDARGTHFIEDALRNPRTRHAESLVAFGLRHGAGRRRSRKPLIAWFMASPMPPLYAAAAVAPLTDGTWLLSCSVTVARIRLATKRSSSG